MAVLAAAYEGLQKSNSTISQSNNFIYHDLDKRLSNLRTEEFAKKWQPKAMLIKVKSSEIIRYIDSLINELNKEAEYQTKDGKTSIKEGNTDIPRRLFIDKSIGKELYKKLKKCKEDILAIDPEINIVFGKNTQIFKNEFELTLGDEKDFTETYFKNTSVLAAKAVLARLKNNIIIIENQTISFCSSKIMDYGCGYTVFRALIGQSSTIVKGGEILKIEAGIGAYTVESKPTIKINGRVFYPDNIMGVAEYKFKTPPKPGKYSIPVIIDYTEPDGRKNTMQTKIEYTVKD